MMKSIYHEDFHCVYPVVYSLCSVLASGLGYVDYLSIGMVDVTSVQNTRAYY
jgi:hypothetical protein